MNQLPENSLRIYDVTFSNIIFNRITSEHARTFIPGLYVLLGSINTIDKYCHA